VDPQRFLRDYAKYNRIWQELLVRTR
jgi:hypothetical protein